jgi:hypothetical protein
MIYDKRLNWFIFISLTLLISNFSTIVSMAQEQVWEQGRLVGLRAGTCIREGPGLRYYAHTRVPENNWTVMIIDGPRTANGRTWWDTSRRAAGDPSGGTGWVTQDQTDTDCDNVAAPAQPAIPTSTSSISVPGSPPLAPITDQDLLRQIREWWYQQSALVKWGVAVLVLLLVSTLWRFVGGAVIEFISAALLALLIWMILNFTRTFWQAAWEELARAVFGGDVPDLALLLGMLPLASWGGSLILRSIRVRL